MNSDQDYLAAQFQIMSDEELVSRVTTCDALTELAHSIALAEAQARGLSLPDLQAVDTALDVDDSYYGDMKMVAHDLTPTEAHLLCSCLQAAGVPAATGDTHLVQANSLLSIAVGGACLRVPEQFVPDAMEVIAAFKRGEFALGEDFDTP
jgi:hypothetical protein